MSERTVQLQAGGTKFSIHDTKFSTYLLEYCTIVKKQLCISRSWPTLVLTTALETLGRPLMLKISRENVI